MMTYCRTVIVAMLLLLGSTSASEAEYIIYLKGGHFIVADDCTFSVRQGVGSAPETGEPSLLVEDCTKGKLEGQIFWSTVSGNFGEVSADDVYAILGTKTVTAIKPGSATTPLEDYLITSRGESFVNAKVVEQQGALVYGLKRDELSKINRRGVIEIVPEGAAKGRSGVGLCPWEAAEFAVSEIEIVSGNLVGVVTNLSKAPWRPRIDAEVHIKGRRLGKFQIEDPNLLAPDESTSIDQPVPTRFVKELERITDPEAGVRLCYRKVKAVTVEPIVEKLSPGQPSK